MTARWVDHLGTGIHSARPAASAVPKGALYACSTHGLVYQSDGSSTWSTWATLGSSLGNDLTLVEETTPSSPSSGSQKLFIDSADHKVKRVNSSGTVTTVEGAGGSTIKDPRWTALAGQTSIDEFNSGSLAGGWTRVDAASGASRADWSQTGDTLAVRTNGGDATAELHALVIALSGFGGSMAVGDGFVCPVDHTSPGTNFAIHGLIVTDGTAHGSGNQVLGDFLMQGSVYNCEARAFTNFNTNGSSATTMAIDSEIRWLRLAQVASNSWRVDASPNGDLWILGSTVSKTITPTHVGFAASSWGTAVKAVTAFDCLRRVSGVS